MSGEILENTNHVIGFNLFGWSSGSLLLVTLALFVLYKFLEASYGVYSNTNKMKMIPGLSQYFFAPFYIPFFAPYAYMGNSKHVPEFIDKYGDKNNKTFRLSFIDRSTLWISDPKLLKEFFITKASHFDKPKFVYEMMNIFGESILTAMNNDTWKKHFKVCSPAFVPKNLMYTCRVATNTCDLMFKSWNRDIEKNGNMLLNIGHYSDMTLDILGKAGFNIDFGIFSDNAEGRKFRESMDLMMAKGLLMRRFLKADSLLYNIFAKITGVGEAIDYCGSTLDRIINERREAVKKSLNGANDDEYSDILSLLVEANVLENLLTDGELKSNAMIMTLAGHETTSTLMQWVSYELSKRPEIQDKLFKEVTEVLNGRDPTYDDVENLHLVNAVLMETLRFRPPVSAVIRQANRNTTLGDYPIPKGTTINPMFQYLHKRADIWSEPNTYMPERFIDPQFREESQHNLTFLAFSFGNRQCIGKKFSLLEACMILAKLIQNYKFRLLNDETVDPVVSYVRVVNRPSKNMKIEITRR